MSPGVEELGKASIFGAMASLGTHTAEGEGGPYKAHRGIHMVPPAGGPQPESAPGEGGTPALMKLSGQEQQSWAPKGRTATIPWTST